MRVTRQSKFQAGIGLLELMLVISLVAVITILSVSYFQSVSNNQKLAQATAMISDIYSASKDYTRANGVNALTSIQPLINAGLLTSYYTLSPWGGSVDVTASGAQVNIEMGAIPLVQCHRLNKRLQQTFTSSGEAVICKKGQHKVQVFYDLY